MTHDYGYSNYTVLETEVDCLKNNNSYFPCEESYSWRLENSPDYKQLQVAENCQYYKEGEGIYFDVDGYTTIDDYKDDLELIDAYNEWNKPSI